MVVLSVEIDGADVSGEVAVPNSGDWNEYTTVKGTTQSISAGSHILRFAIDQPSFNIDKIEFVASGTHKVNQNLNYQTTGMVKYEIFDLKGHLLMQKNSMNQNVNQFWKNMNKSLSNWTYLIRYSENGKKYKTQKVYKTSL